MLDYLFTADKDDSESKLQGLEKSTARPPSSYTDIE